MSGMVSKYCPSVSVKLLCTQPQPTQQTLHPTPLHDHSPPLEPSSPPCFHLSSAQFIRSAFTTAFIWTSHSFWLPDIKQDWCGKYCGSDSLATDSTTHTHIHTPSFCKLDRMHMLFHWSTKLLQIRTYSLMAKGWRWWDHQTDQKPTDHSPVQEHDTHTHTCYICLFCLLHPVFSHHISWLSFLTQLK